VWSGDPTVPLKGGDSRVSWERRVASAKARLHKLSGTTVIVADERMVLELTGAKGTLEWGHVYAFEHKD
jgi:hypothetical protein